MKERELSYTRAKMTKEQFFYAYKQLAQTDKSHLLLESGRGGNLCIAGIHPLATLRAMKEDALLIQWRNGTEEIREGEPLNLLTDFVRSYEFKTIPELPEFQGGVAGFISYDYVRRYEDITSDTIDDLGTPDLFFYHFDQWAVLDIETENVYFIALPESQLDLMDMKNEWMAAAVIGLEEQLFTPGEATGISEETGDLEVSVTWPQFEEMVRDVQSYI